MSLNQIVNPLTDADFKSLKIQGITVTPGAGGGNVTSTQTGTADGEVCVYSGTSGTLIKKSGIVQSLSTLILNDNDLTDTGKLLPKFTDSKDIGSNTSNLRYKDIHISGDVYKNGVPISGGGGGGGLQLYTPALSGVSLTNFADLSASYSKNGNFLTMQCQFKANCIGTPFFVQVTVSLPPGETVKTGVPYQWGIGSGGPDIVGDSIWCNSTKTSSANSCSMNLNADKLPNNNALVYWSIQFIIEVQ